MYQQLRTTALATPRAAAMFAHVEDAAPETLAELLAAAGSGSRSRPGCVPSCSRRSRSPCVPTPTVPAPPATPDKAAGGAQHVAALWAALEERYLNGRYDGTGRPDSLRHVPGPRPVLLTAPHAVTHIRDGARKPADMTTGGLAETLAELTGCIALTCDGTPTRDPNYDPDGPFKSRLDTLLPGTTAVLDLHGMQDTWGPDVCLARGLHPAGSADLLEVCRRELTASGFTVSVGDPYDANTPHTVTSYCQRAGVPAVELELARRIRNPWDQPETSARLLAALQNALIAAGG